MRRLLLITLLSLLPDAAHADGESPPIPQDPARQAKYYRDLLAWNRKTLAGAYDTVGKKSPAWDAPAREALEAAALQMSDAVDADSPRADIYTPAARAVIHGCDDPLILYLYARNSTGPHDPGPDDRDARWLAAAKALEASTYPPLRRAAALYKAGQVLAAKKSPTPAVRKEAARLLDAALAMVPEGVAHPDPDFADGYRWFEVAQNVRAGQQRLTGSAKAAFDRVDAALARHPTLKVLRLQLRGDFFADYAWEARGGDIADRVADEAWPKYRDRLAEARLSLEQAWALEPRGARTPTLMLWVILGQAGARTEFEQWFRRALEADGNNLRACRIKLDYLDPKWHGTPEQLLAFGRACHATRNWRAKIPALLPEAHLRLAYRLDADGRDAYFQAPALWNELHATFEEALKAAPDDHQMRSLYAAFAAMGQHDAEADRQFTLLGDNLVGSSLLPLDMLKDLRDQIDSEDRTPSPEDAQPATPQPSTTP